MRFVEFEDPHPTSPPGAVEAKAGLTQSVASFLTHVLPDANEVLTLKTRALAGHPFIALIIAGIA